MRSSSTSPSPKYGKTFCLMAIASFFVVGTALWPGVSSAQTPACDRLAGEHKRLAAKLLATLHPYDCCDETLAACLSAKRVCRLAHRLADNVCRRVAASQTEEVISRWMYRRARSMMPWSGPVGIAFEDVPEVGAPEAPISLVEYACPRCPYCAKLTVPLHREIVEGRLKGKVRLAFKTFPIRGHKYAKEAGLAFVAAARAGRFWPFMLHVYAHFDDLEPALLPKWAVSAGIDAAEFGRLVEDPVTRARLVASKKEGLRNKVEATPTFFINGRTYWGGLEIEELIDVLEEAHDSSEGLVYRD